MPSNKYKVQAAMILSVAAPLYAGASSAAMDPEVGHVRYLCISESAAGLIHRGGGWEGTTFKSGEKYIIAITNGALVSVKAFGAPDETALTFCRKLEPTQSYECASNFDTFRFQPSTKKFVYSQTAGYTTEFEEDGLPLPNTEFTPNISVGRCERI